MESDIVTLQDLFIAKPVEDNDEVTATGSRLLGPLRCTGIKPHFLEQARENGVHLPAQFFQIEADRVGVTSSAFGRAHDEAGARAGRRPRGGARGHRLRPPRRRLVDRLRRRHALPATTVTVSRPAATG